MHICKNLNSYIYKNISGYSEFIWNKEIKHLCWRCLALKNEALKFFINDCSKIVCPKTCFLEQTFLGAASALEFWYSISVDTNHKYMI